MLEIVKKELAKGPRTMDQLVADTGLARAFVYGALTKDLYGDGGMSPRPDRTVDCHADGTWTLRNDPRADDVVKAPDGEAAAAS